MTQQELADAAKLDVSVIIRAEQNAHIDRRSLRAIANALGLPDCNWLRAGWEVDPSKAKFQVVGKTAIYSSLPLLAMSAFFGIRGQPVLAMSLAIAATLLIGFGIYTFKIGIRSLAIGVKILCVASGALAITWGVFAVNDYKAQADRDAARYVLSIGGTVRVKGANKEGEEKDIKAEADLPRGPLVLTWVDLGGNKVVTDAGLERLMHCKGIDHLDLDNTTVGDAGLASFKGITTLKYLGLGRTKVSARGLLNFRECAGLIHLDLFGTEVSDAGLQAFKGCKNLEMLQVGNNSAEKDEKKQAGRMGDAGLALFEDCPNLKTLTLSCTNVTEEGVMRFKDRKTLERVTLTGTMTKAQIDRLKAAFRPGVIFSEWDKM